MSKITLKNKVTLKDKAIKKERRYRPTRKQRLAARTLVESGSLKEGLIKAGYSENTAIAPTKVTESKGFIAAMEEIGLTDDYLNECLLNDIKQKKGNRLGELTLAYKLKGKLTEKKEGNKTLILNISGQAGERYRHLQQDDN